MRQYTAYNLVTLPRVDASGALALATQIIAVGKREADAPTPVRKSLASIATAADALSASMKSRFEPDAGDARIAREADIKVDAAWAALINFLVAWSRLPDVTESERARAILEQVFPDNLAFTQLPWREEWAQSETRLRVLDEKGFSKTIEELGGAKFMKSLRRAHKEYGVALGITRPGAPAPAPPPLRDVLDELLDTIRHFVVQATAMQRRDDPGNTAISMRLLQPVSDCESRARTNAPKEPPADPAVSEPPVQASPS